MSPSFLDAVKIQLTLQKEYFTEERSTFLDRYFPQWGKERNNVAQILINYTEKLGNILSNLDTEILHHTVLIGSRVIMNYVDDEEEETFTIVFPNQIDPDRNFISFLSPIGSQLLMTTHGEVRTIAIPSGNLKVMIKDIQYANLGEPDEA